MMDIAVVEEMNENPPRLPGRRRRHGKERGKPDQCAEAYGTSLLAHWDATCKSERKDLVCNSLIKGFNLETRTTLRAVRGAIFQTHFLDKRSRLVKWKK